MDHFEYVMVIVSIILGLSLTQVLRGLSKLARSAQPSVIVVLWAFLLFLLHLQVWWAFWDLNQVKLWTQFYFVFVALIPCTLFGMTELLMPLASKPDTRWEDHFLSIRLWFFRLFLFFIVVAILETWLILKVPLTHPYRGIQTFMFGLGALGLLTTNLRIHRWIVVAVIVCMIFAQVAFRLLPGLR